MSDYGIDTTVDADFPTTLAAARAALSEQGFGVLTEIDVAATMKAKLDVDTDPYVILGACNPPLAHQALTAEPSIGLLLPCNVVVRAAGDRRTVVSAVDPETMVTSTGNPALQPVAEQARQRLVAALDTLHADLSGGA
jgi:uncharacterized protein (DUF302 family)